MWSPVFKKGAKNRPENYRPVSLTSITCKMLEHIITSSIMRHLEQHEILTDAQHGFRKQRSCETQLIITLQDLAKTVDDKGQSDVILLDFSKAFDKVPHKRLMHKLQHYGIRGSLHSWISDFLHDRTQAVVLENGKVGYRARPVRGPTRQCSRSNALPAVHQRPARLHNQWVISQTLCWRLCLIQACQQTWRCSPTPTRPGCPPRMGKGLVNGIPSPEMPDPPYHKQKTTNKAALYYPRPHLGRKWSQQNILAWPFKTS